MYSAFFGLELAYRALSTYQTALDVTGHNISNASTNGYTRQVANIQTAIPLTINVDGKKLTLGTGSTLQNVTRARDSFIDRQFRWENSKYEYWATKKESLNMMEGLMNEPTEYSLSEDMSKFWNAWSELAKNPQNMGARSVLKERALTLVDTLHHIDQQITDLQGDLDTGIKVAVGQINTIADQIKELNIRIKNAEVSLDNANDLKDQRDTLIDELSKLVPVRVEESQDPNFTDRSVGIYKVIIGNTAAGAVNTLIDGQTIKRLTDPPPTTVDGFSRVVWEGSADSVDLGEQMGQLKAKLDLRDSYLKDFRSQFDALAKGIAAAVNVLHQNGQGLVAETGVDGSGNPIGIDFFTIADGSAEITAANIRINQIILDDINRIATGKIPLDTSTSPPTHAKDESGNDLVEAGDSSVALQIASFAQGWESIKTQISGDYFGAGGAKPVDASSFGDCYGAIIAKMGVDIQQAERMAEGQTTLVNHMSNQRESASGVSLDEEMANLIKFQKCYSAAARIVTMLDSIYEKILGMGVTR